MANLTIAIDEKLLHGARVRAAQLGTSVNAVLREYLGDWTGASDRREQAVATLLEMSRRSRSARGGRRSTRDDLHEQ